MHDILHRLGPAALLLAALGLSACSSGGGGGGGGNATLLKMTFPDPSNQSPGRATRPPNNASLVQQLILVFSSAPDPAAVSSQTVAVREVGTKTPARGTYDVVGNSVVFTPNLPTRPATIGGGVIDTGGAGLTPATSYFIRLDPDDWPFLSAIAPDVRAAFGDQSDDNAVIATFSTTSDPALFFTGVADEAPQLVGTSPSTGTLGISPMLNSDPDGLFPESSGFLLFFDRPVRPDLSNISDRKFALLDMDDNDLSLGINVRVLSNTLNGATVEVTPNGILPFGNMLCLEYPARLKGLAQTGGPNDSRKVAATFSVASVPPGVVTIEDEIFENFDTSEAQEDDFSQISLTDTMGQPAIQPGQQTARWDQADSDVLQASIAVEQGGLLGDFRPQTPAAGDSRTIIFDTNSMSFPLLDGSTPDAPPNTVVTGGVFDFDDIYIPPGIIISPIGSNPLVFNATGTICIAGRIDANGGRGTPENAYDSATTSLPGGAGRAGGGRGGEGQPILYFPPTQVSNLTLVSPPFGGRGWGPGNVARTGGTGGESGMRDISDANGLFGTDREIDCGEICPAPAPFNDGFCHNNGYKPPGGGGGSFLTVGGTADGAGQGNVTTDGLGGFRVAPEPVINGIIGVPNYLAQGPPGPPPFADGNPDNDFVGPAGELQLFNSQGQPNVLSGQGGGAGGSALDSYFCGPWCKSDGSAANDSVCMDESNGLFAGAVGDARGGAGGAGGGMIVLRALKGIAIEDTAILLARGGKGGGGEALGCGNWSGAGGSGAGGSVIVQSGDYLDVEEGCRIDVNGGDWSKAVAGRKYVTSCTGRDNHVGGTVRGDGGFGGAGIIQLQVPFGSTVNFIDDMTPGIDLSSIVMPVESYVDQNNTLNPSQFDPISVALSKWYDMGRVITRSPASPVFEFMMNGQLAQATDTGIVGTDAIGHVIKPARTDVVCDYLGQIDQRTGQFKLGQEPAENFIPTNADVVVEFQSADAITPGSKEVNPATISDWSATPAVANGRQFIRYRITFNVTAGGGDLTSDTPLPVVQEFRIRTSF